MEYQNYGQAVVYIVLPYVVEWKFDEISGSTLYDTLNTNNLTVTGALTLNQAGPNLYNSSDRAVTFPGSTSAYAVKTSPTGLPTGASARSIEVWFKTTSTATQTLISYGTASTRQSFGLKINGSNSIGFWTYSDDGYYPATVNNGAWHQLVVTYNGGVIVYAYLDGIQIGGKNLGGTLNTVVNANGIVVGKDFHASANAFNGQIGQIKVYNFKLSPIQISSQYNLILRGFSLAQAQAAIRGFVYAQTQTEITPTKAAFAQSEVFINNWNVFAQAQAFIFTYISLGQAETFIGPRYKIAQAKILVDSPIKNALASVRAQITATTIHGLAQVKIWDQRAFGQAHTNILLPFYWEDHQLKDDVFEAETIYLGRNTYIGPQNLNSFTVNTGEIYDPTYVGTYYKTGWIKIVVSSSMTLRIDTFGSTGNPYLSLMANEPGSFDFYNWGYKTLPACGVAAGTYYIEVSADSGASLDSVYLRISSTSFPASSPQALGQAQVYIYRAPQNDTQIYSQSLTYTLREQDYYNEIIDNDDPLAYYKFNEDVDYLYNDGIIDSLGNRNIIYNYSNGESKPLYIQGPIWPDFRGIQLGQSYVYYYSSTQGLFTGTQGWAIEYWVRPNNPDQSWCFRLYDYNTSDYYIYLGLGDPSNVPEGSLPWYNYTPNVGTQAILAVYDYTNSTYYYNYIASPSPISNEDWHHVVGTLSNDGTTLKLYVDGKLVASKALGHNANKVWTGWHQYIPDDSAYNVQIDDYVIYDHELTEDRVLRHYNLVNYVSSDTQFIWSQAQTFVVYQDGNTYTRFNVGQAQVYSGSYKIFAQAICIIKVITDSYGLLVAQDGAVHLYGMHLINASGGSDIYYWDDDIGTADVSSFSGTFNYTLSPIGSEYYGLVQSTTSANRYWTSSATNRLKELYDVTKSWTIETWVRSPGSANQQGWVWSLGATSPGYYLAALGFGSGTTNPANGNQIIVHFYNPTTYGTVYDTGITYTPNTWYHTAVTYNGNKVFSVYINGTLVKTINYSYWLYNLPYFYLAYNFYWGSNSVVLAYDNLAIYPFELSLSKIISHSEYRATITNAYASASFQINSNKYNQYASAAFYPWNPTGTNKVQQYSQAASYRPYYVFGQANAITNVIQQSYYGLAVASILQTYPLPDYKAVVLADTPDVYWPFDDSTVTTAKEIVANKIATLGGSSTSPTPNTYIGYGGIDPGWSWAGTSRYVYTSYAQPSTNIAIVEAWFKTTGTGEIWQGRYNLAGNTSGKGITLTLNSTVGFGCENGKLNFFVNSDGILHGIKSNNFYNDNQLYHVVAAWRSSTGVGLNNSQFSLYVNGVQISTTNLSTAGSATAPLAGNTDTPFAGARYGVFSGYLSNIAFYTHDLTTDQILAHYDARGLAVNARPFGQAQVYIGHFLPGLAQALIRQTTPNYPVFGDNGPFGLAQTIIWPFKFGLAIAQIAWEQEGYRKTVLADKPILYYPMEEPNFNNDLTNLVRYPVGGSANYSASSVYSASYSVDKAADGNYADGWAALGYTSGEYWKVTWTVPQTFKTLRLVARPGNDYFGIGYIELYDGTNTTIIDNITYPPTPNGSSIYTINAENILSMKLVSTSGGVSNPGFSEVEAFDAYDAAGVLHTIVGRRNGYWTGASATFNGVSPVYPGKSIAFNGNAVYISPNVNYTTITENLTIPGIYSSVDNHNIIGNDFWAVTGDTITFRLKMTNGSPYSIGVYDVTNGGANNWLQVASQYSYIDENGYKVFNITITATGFFHPYIYSYSSSYAGTGTITRKHYDQDSMIPIGDFPTPNNACVTIESWVKWDGTTNRMIFGFDWNDLFVISQSGIGFIGFNTGNSDNYGVAALSVGGWYHIVAVFYAGQYTTIKNKLYINGVRQELAYIDGNISRQYPTFGQDFYIGSWPTNTSYQWTGALDEFAIFNYELTPEQILTHYNARTNFQAFAYSQAHIYVYGGSGDPPYPRNQMYAGAFTHVNTHFGIAQAEARIIGTYYLGSQALALTTTPGQGLMRMIWNGGAYAIENIFNWYIEDGASQPNYSNGNPIPYFPGPNGGAAWSARFVADEEGWWQFQTYSDDNSELWINNTRVVANNGGGGSGSFFEGGQSPTYSSVGSIYLYDGAEYNLHLRFGNLNNSGWVIGAWYKRPTDSELKYLTNGSPPWLDAPKTRKYSQAQAEIFPQPRRNQSAQAEANIIRIIKVHAQAQVRVSWQHWAQANARIIAFNVNAYGQARVVAGHQHHANAQAKLNSFDWPQWGQSQANIYKSAGYGLARAHIYRTEYCIGYAVAIILGGVGKGITQANIKQTYPLMSMDVNYALISQGATAFDSTGQQDVPYYAIDGDDLGSAWILGGAALGQFLVVNLGQYRTINFIRILPVTYNCVVRIEYLVGTYRDDDEQNTWINVAELQFNVSYFEPVNTAREVKAEVIPTTAQYWRIKVIEFGDYEGISIASFDLGWATVKSPTFAQAQASFGRWVAGQASFYISPGKGWQWGQAKTAAINTFQTYAQANAYYIPPTTFGIANSDILQTYLMYANANCLYLIPTFHGIAQARIVGFDIPHIAYAQTSVKQTYLKFAQAKATIWKRTGFAQALAIIKNFKYRVYGLARTTISTQRYAIATAYIKKSGGTAHTTALIREHNINHYAYARTSIKFPPMGLALAHILRMYQKYAQAESLLNTGLKTASVQANIEQTYQKYSQTQVGIKQTYYTSSQALTVVKIRYRMDGQARTVVQIQRTRVGQSMVWVGYHKFSQAQTQIQSFNVPKFGIANGYILIGHEVIPPSGIPSSNYQTYLVRYNNQTLPGYAQSESYKNDLTIAINNAPYMDASLNEDLGLKNIIITIEMLLWEETYQKCKDKLQLAATILRSNLRGQFVPLYIQRYDKYYLALVRSITVTKTVPESSRILKYTVEFEAKPWQMNIDGTSTAPAPPPIEIPPELLPPPPIIPTPSVIYREKFGMSQVKINSFGTIKNGLTQTKIIRTEGYGLSRVFIYKIIKSAQAGTRIKRNYRINAQAQTSITRKLGIGQARSNIIRLPGPPTNLTVTPGDEKVTLNWNPPSYS
jgi:hypothetical protein